MKERKYIDQYDYIAQRYSDLDWKERHQYLLFNLKDIEKVALMCDLIDFSKEHRDITVYSNDSYRSKTTISIILPEYVFTVIHYRGKVNCYNYKNLEREELSFEEAREQFNSFKDNLPNLNEYQYALYGTEKASIEKFKVKEIKNAFEILGFSNDFTSLLLKAVGKNREVVEGFILLMLSPEIILNETQDLIDEVGKAYVIPEEVSSEIDYAFRLLLAANSLNKVLSLQDVIDKLYRPQYNSIRLGYYILSAFDKDGNEPNLDNLYLPLAVPSFLNLYLNTSPFVSKIAADWTLIKGDPDDDCDTFIRSSKVLDLFRRYKVEDKLDYVLGDFKPPSGGQNYQSIDFLTLRSNRDLTELKKLFPTFIKFDNWPYHLRELLFTIEEDDRPLKELMAEEMERMIKEETGIDD